MPSRSRSSGRRRPASACSGSGAAGAAVLVFAALGLAVVLAARPHGERVADDARRVRHRGGGARVDAPAGGGARHAARARRGAGVAGLPRRVARPALVRRRLRSTPSPCCSSRSARERSRRESYAGLTRAAAAAALLALPALYVTSVAARTLRRGCPVKLFEAVQGSLAARPRPRPARRASSRRTARRARFRRCSPSALGALCYAVAFAHAERRPGQGRNFYFYSSAGGLLMLGGTLELGLGAGAAARVDGARHGRGRPGPSLRPHDAAGARRAATCSRRPSSPACCRRARAALAGLSPGELPPSAWVVAVGAAVAWAVLAREAGRRRRARAAAAPAARARRRACRSPRRRARRQASPSQSPLAQDAGSEAVARSAVLVALVLGLAWLVGRGQPELVWLVYPLVALGAAKLLLYDARLGRPATLVASLGALRVAADPAAAAAGRRATGAG